MASARAQEVAEILWELKRAGKVGTYTTVARRAGFSPGANGRTIIATLAAVRRDWPHLQWWRAVPDDFVLEKGSEHATLVEENGFELEEDGEKVKLSAPEENQMIWEEEADPEATSDTVSEEEEEEEEVESDDDDDDE